jgi:predicted GIY-YIG superfamily endonuclease
VLSATKFVTRPSPFGLGLREQLPPPTFVTRPSPCGLGLSGTTPAAFGLGAAVSDNPRVYFVYMVRCADGSLYTGFAQDVDQRIAAHNSRKGAKYTASRLPVTLVYRERCPSLSHALKRECQIKSWTRAEKEALIATTPA